MSGAVSRLPFETSGLAPRISRWSVRSTSGTGTDSIAPNISPALTCLGIWSTVERGVDVLRAERAQPDRPVRERGQVVRVRVADVDGDRVAPVLGEQRREPRGRSPRTPRPRSPRRARRRGRTSGVVRRSGSSCSCLSPDAFGQMKPWLRTSCVVAADRRRPPLPPSPPRVRRWLRRRDRSGSGAPCAQVTPAAPRSRAPARRTAAARRSRTARRRRARLRPSTASGQERIAWRSPTPTEAPEPRGQPRQHHRRAVGEVGHRRAGRAVERRPDALGPHVAGAVVERLVGRPVGAANMPSRSAPGNRRSPSPGSRSGPQAKQVGKGWWSHQWSRPAAEAAAASSGEIGSGTSSSSSAGAALRHERVAVAQLDALAVAHHRAAACRSAAAGAATPSPPRRRPGRPPARRCSRRSPTPGGPLKRGGDGQRLGHRLRPAGEASIRVRRGGRQQSGSRGRAGGRAGGPTTPVLVHDHHRSAGRRAGSCGRRTPSRPCRRGRRAAAPSGRAWRSRRDGTRRSAWRSPRPSRSSASNALGLVAVGAELPRAHGGVVAGVEEEHHALAAMVGEPEGAGGAVELEVGVRGRPTSGRGHAERMLRRAGSRL